MKYLALFLTVLPFYIHATDIPPGNITESNWTLAGSPYIVLGDIRLATEDSLVIDPGVEVLFAGPYFMRILGSIRAQGAPGDSIDFKSQSGTAIWKGILLDSLANNSDTARFEYCRISEMINKGCKVINSGRVRFENSHFFDNEQLYIGSLYIALANPIIEHCKFTNNQASGNNGGAAVYIWDASPIFLNTEFFENNAGNGAAASIWRSNIPTEPNFINCSFINNHSSGGGAVSSHDNTLPYFENCQFTGNSSSGNGGAIWDGYTLVGTTQYINCHFENNHCESDGGAVYQVKSLSLFESCSFLNNNSLYGKGGAVYAYDEAVITFESCDFIGNFTNGQGGALHINDYSILNVNRCYFGNNSGSLGGAFMLVYYTNANITNSIISNNESSSVGGAMRLVQYCNPNISNCVFTNNHSGGDGGAFSLYWQSNPILTNCIFWGNIADGLGNTFGAQDYIWHSCHATFDNCGIENGDTSFFLNETGTATCTNCFTEDPLFIEPSLIAGNTSSADEANWQLSTSSPYIDSGTGSSSSLNLGSLDFSGNPRLIGIALDLGAYEGGLFVLPYEQTIDFDNNGITNTNDLILFLTYFGCTGSCLGDLNNDGIVNTEDLLLFIAIYSY